MKELERFYADEKQQELYLNNLHSEVSELQQKQFQDKKSLAEDMPKKHKN